MCVLCSACVLWAQPLSFLNACSHPAPLQPIMRRSGGRIAFRAPGQDASLSSLTLVQMLLAAYFLMSEDGFADESLRLISRVLEAVWPSSSDSVSAAAVQQLRQRRWLPAFTPEMAAAQQAADLEVLPLTPAARSLDSDLRQHCPDVTLSALHRWALQLRVMHLDKLQRPRGMPAAAPPDQLAMQQQLLQDCQLILRLAAADQPAVAMYAAFGAATVLLSTQQPALQPASMGAEGLAMEALDGLIAAKSE